jgi:hypothetical protein
MLTRFVPESLASRQNLLSLTGPKTYAARAGMHSCCLLRYGYIGFCFVRHQCSPWLTLAIVPLKLLCASEAQQTHLQIRYLSAISRINFVGVYGALNELLW